MNKQLTKSTEKVSILKDSLSFITLGAKAIAQDEFSLCFKSEPRINYFPSLIETDEPPTAKHLRPHDWLWWLDLMARYFVLFPLRLSVLLLSSIIMFALLPFVHFTKDKEVYQRFLFKMYCKSFLFAFGANIKFHSKKPTNLIHSKIPHLYVSNHTSIIDYLVISSDTFSHATISQSHGGVIGFFQRVILSLNGSLMFNRNEKNDRSIISQKMKQHVKNTQNVPLLIFPEGTCVNNEYTLLFHKGAFELDSIVVPVAIKYNKSSADAYWSSKNQTFTQHIIYLMTRWSLVADVWYLEPQSKAVDESSSDFANRVKEMISSTAGLKSLSWDGYLKNFVPHIEKQQKMVKRSQLDFFKKSSLSRFIRNKEQDSHDTLFKFDDKQAIITKPSLLSLSLETSKAAGVAPSIASADSMHVPISYLLPTNNDSLLSPSPKSNTDRFLHTSPKKFLDIPIPSSKNASLTANVLYSKSQEPMPTTIRNAIIVAIESGDRNRTEMIKHINHKQNDIVRTWKKYTSKKDDDFARMRIEYSSWRVWFKQRVKKQVGDGEVEFFPIESEGEYTSSSSPLEIPKKRNSAPTPNQSLEVISTRSRSKSLDVGYTNTPPAISCIYNLATTAGTRRRRITRSNEILPNSNFVLV